jgi:hypothetical protein
MISGRQVRVPRRRVARHLARGEGPDLETARKECSSATLRRNGSCSSLGQVRRLAETARHSSEHQEVKNLVKMIKMLKTV